jgi:hypothetical protein
MQIFLVLLILAALVLITLAGVFISSLLLGGMLAASKKAQLLTPIFLVVIPAAAAGALLGGIVVGYFAIKANDNLILLGPLGGLIAGGAAGLSIGTVGALIWWRKIARTPDSDPTAS